MYIKVTGINCDWFWENRSKLHIYKSEKYYCIAQNVGGRKYWRTHDFEINGKKMLANCKNCGTLFTAHLESDSTACDITLTRFYIALTCML